MSDSRAACLPPKGHRRTRTDFIARPVHHQCRVPAEAVSDRWAAPHEANLFDIDTKYGDVLPEEEVADYLRALPEPIGEPRLADAARA